MKKLILLRTRTSKLLFSLMVITLLSSCQKVIDIDLNSSSPQIVIEGNVSDQPGPHYVKISKTANFSDANTFPVVAGALVKLADNTGITEILTEISPGTYSTSPTLQGIVGRTYTLTVNSEGKEYVANATIPVPVNIDTLTIDKGISFGGRRPNKRVQVHFQDSLGVANYYHFVLTHNGMPQKAIYITSDRIQDGNKRIYNLSDRTDTINSGDHVTVALQAIDGKVYEYFRTLNQANNSGQSATPANPVSNLSNGALGYFSAYSVKTKSIFIP